MSLKWNETNQLCHRVPTVSDLAPELCPHSRALCRRPAAKKYISSLRGPQIDNSTESSASNTLSHTTNFLLFRLTSDTLKCSSSHVLTVIDHFVSLYFKISIFYCIYFLLGLLLFLCNYFVHLLILYYITFSRRHTTNLSRLIDW